MTHHLEPDLRAALSELKDTIPRLVQLLGLDQPAGEDAAWLKLVDLKLLPRLAPDFPLVAAICGGGSSGKSTLFNSLAGERLSPTGGRAGMNRRVLAALNPQLLNRAGVLPLLFEPFGCTPEPLQTPLDLTRPGCPLYVAHARALPTVVLLDTPDFDTGSRRDYTNRAAAHQALEAADFLIYVFTNANYSNRANTDFIARMLTGVGRRKCFLIYRVYPSFSDAEVREHARTVARNLYGDRADDYLLGIYRADEDNRVAAGERLMRLQPVPPSRADIREALGAIDYRRLRSELLDSILQDTLRNAGALQTRAALSLGRLTLYRDALRTAQSHCVQEALRHFPMDLVLRRFAEIWLATDPPHVKALRQAGGLINLPMKWVAGTVRWARHRLGDIPPPAPQTEFKRLLEEDLVVASTHLRDLAAGEAITVTLARSDPVARRMLNVFEELGAAAGGKRLRPDAEEPDAVRFEIEAHASVVPEQRRLASRDWHAVLQGIVDRKGVVTSLSEGIEAELAGLAQSLRSRMGFTARVRQTFSALLNVLPATAAVTYILSTGDPVGAVGIKVKLSGLIGLHDLYALVAIPATSGMKKADRMQLEAMIEPLARTWLNRKMEALQDLFVQEITGGILGEAQAALTEAERLLARVAAAIQTCETALR